MYISLGANVFYLNSYIQYISLGASNIYIIAESYYL